MKRIVLATLMMTGTLFTADNNDQNINLAPQQMFGNINTDQVLIQHQNVHVHPKIKPHQDANKTFAQKFSTTLANGAWQSLGSVPALLTQIVVTAGVQLTVQQVNNWINQPQAEDKKVVEQLTNIAKVKTEIEVGSTLEGGLEQLHHKYPDNEKIAQSLEKAREKNLLLANKFAQLIEAYNQDGINNLKKN